MLRALIAALALTTVTAASAQDRGVAADGSPVVFNSKVLTTAAVMAVPLIVLAITATAIEDNDNEDAGNPTPGQPPATSTTTSTSTSTATSTR